MPSLLPLEPNKLVNFRTWKARLSKPKMGRDANFGLFFLFVFLVLVFHVFSLLFIPHSVAVGGL